MNRKAGNTLLDPAGGDARELAWNILVAVEEGGFADALLGRALENASLERRDEAFATRLVYSTIAWQGLLDHLIGACGRPANRMDVPVRCLLRMALLQLTKLDRVPEFAAVDTAVELSKSFKKGAATGLVNAVLRRFLRERQIISVPRREDGLTRHLAVSLSHPQWLVERWLDELGEAPAEALLAADNEVAPTVLRVNRRRADRERVVAGFTAEGIACRPCAYSVDGIVLTDGVRIPLLPGHSSGWFTVQGEASQLVTALLDVQPGMRVLDACAAPGGKATHVAERMDDRGEVVAIDSNEHGNVHLRETASRLGLDAIRPICADLFVALANEKEFDAVLLDAPCSGLGTLRQHPEIRWRRSPKTIAAVAELQSRMLDAVAEKVRPGGVLVYSTCTISRTENDDVVARFLHQHADFSLRSAAEVLPEHVRPLVDAGGFLRTYPHRDGLDGFFAARMVRQG